MGTRALVILCGICLGVANVLADRTYQVASGLEFVPRFTRLLRSDVGGVASYLLPTDIPPLCEQNCCQDDSYASPYGLIINNKTQQTFGGRTYTTFFFVFHSNSICNSDLDEQQCCSASADTLWIDVDPTLKVKYVSFNGERLINTQQTDFGLMLGAIKLQSSAAAGGVPISITVEGAVDTLCPPPGLAPAPGLCEVIVQGTAGSNPNACCPRTVSAYPLSGIIVPAPITTFECSASLENSPYKLVLDDVTNIQQNLVYNFRLMPTEACREDGVRNCCNRQLRYLNLKVTEVPITLVQIGDRPFNFTTSSWNEPNSANYKSLLVEDINLMADDLGDGLPLTITVKKGSNSNVDLCDASTTDASQGGCSYFLHSEDGFCCPSGLALPRNALPPPPPGTCFPTQVVPATETSMSLRYYERKASAAFTTFSFLLANNNPAQGCTHSYCVDVCSWTLFLNPAVVSDVVVGHDHSTDRGTEKFSYSFPASVTFTYGPAGVSTTTYYLTLPAGGKYLTDLCARNALPNQGNKACAAIVSSASVKVMVFFDDDEVIIIPGPTPPPMPPICTAPKDMAESCLAVSSAHYNTLSAASVFKFPVSAATSSDVCIPPAPPTELAMVHLLLSPVAIDQLTTKKKVQPSTGLWLDRNDGARWSLSPSAATSLTFQLQGALSVSEVCLQNVTPDQPENSCVVEISGSVDCFRGYVRPTVDNNLIWVDAPAPTPGRSKSGASAGVVVPAIVVPLIALLAALVVGFALYRRRKNQQYFFMNSGSDDLDRPLATQSGSHPSSIRDEASAPSATASDVHIRVPGASQGGAGLPGK